MTSYRRACNAGATYFFTVNLADRTSALLTQCIDELRDAVRHVQLRHPFAIDAMVVLPEHLHAVWTLPPNDADHSLRWRLIKTRFSNAMPHGERRCASRIAKGERGVWQRRYWEHLIRNDDDFGRHVDYVHFNPVKHGYVSHAIDWPHSSVHRCVADGRLPADWGGGADGRAGFGESR